MLTKLTTIGTALVLLTSTTLAQTIYQGKDAHGNPVFTDQPRKGDKPVDLPPVNTAPPPTSLPAAPPRDAGFAGYSQIALSAPGSVPNPYVPVDVQIAIEPELRDGHLWRLSLDGGVVAEGRESSYSFPSLDRGQHTLELEVTDANGQVVGQAAPANVFVQFVKADNAGRPNRVRPAPH